MCYVGMFVYCILYIELMYIVVVEIFGFEISIVSNRYLSVFLFFYAQDLFNSLEVVNLTVSSVQLSFSY